MTDSEQGEQITYEELCKMYGKPRSSHNPYSKIQPLESACGIVAMATLVLLVLLTYIFYSRPIIVMGGEKVFGKTVDIFTFIRERSQSISEQINGITNLETDDIIGIMSLLQQMVAFAVSVCVGIAQIVIIVIAIIKFVKRQMLSIPRLLFTSVAWNMVVYFVFTFLCNVSGGIKEYFYYIGDVAGIGMNVGMVLALCGLIACGIICCLCKKEYIISNNLSNNLKRVIINAVPCLAICALMTFIPISKVLTYVMTASLSLVVGAILTNSFSFASLIFSILNLFLFIGTISLFSYAVNILKHEVGYIFQIDQPQKITVNIRKKKSATVKLFNCPFHFLPLTVLGTACIVALQIPEIGLGWSVYILPHFIMFDIISVIWCICRLIF